MIFQEYILGDLAELIAMGPFGSDMKKSFFVDSGIPIISGAHLTKTKLNEREDFNFLTEEKANKHKRSLVTRGDVIFTAYGSIGQVCFIPIDSRFETYIVSQRQFFLRPKKELLDYKYLTYFFKTNYGQHLLLANASQTGVPSIARPTSYLKSLKIKLPSISYQQKISSIISTLDKKIELNLIMNNTLEEIAKTLFKSWFVDFDPVKAKAEGRPTGLSKEISDLFPDSFEESELGEIPKGWEVKKVGECMEFNYGKALTAKNRVYGNIPVYGSNGIVGYHDTKNSNGPGIIVGRAGNPGTVHWSQKDYFVIDSAFSVNITNNVSAEYFFYALKNLRLQRLNTGSAIPGLNRNHAYSEKIVVPKLKLLEWFNQFSQNIFAAKDCRLAENKNLSEIRDTLLPKLISGKIKVPDLDESLEKDR